MDGKAHFIMNRVIVLSIFCFSLVGCGADEPVYDVPLTFQPYVDRFIDMAAEYGHDIDFSDTGLTIRFRERVDLETGGVCRGDHLIEIEKVFWEDLSEFDKEGLIFHELGHCELFRGHRNDKLPNGEWASRMRGSPIPEGSNAVINYAGSRLAYYRQEFFNTALAAPDWVDRRAEYDDPAILNRIEVVSIQNQETFEESAIGISQGNFEIEVDMISGTSEGFVGIQFMGAANDDRIRVGFNRDGLFAIDSGNDVWGLMYLEEDFDKVLDGANKITIRRQGDFYYVFLNEEFIYWFDYKIPQRESVASLNAGTLGVPWYMSVKVYSI